MTGQSDTAGPAGIPVLATVADAFATTWRLRTTLFRLALLPGLLGWALIATGFAGGLAVMTAPLYVLAQGLLLPLLAVAFAGPWLRVVAGGAPPRRLLAWTRAETACYAVVMVWTASAALCFTLGWVLFFGDPEFLLRGIRDLLPAALVDRLGWDAVNRLTIVLVIGALFAPPMWLFVRTALALPRLAAGAGGGIAAGWRLGRGIQTRLALVALLAWMPFRLVSAIMKQGLPAGFRDWPIVLLPQLAGEAANFLALAVLLSALSHVYTRRLDAVSRERTLDGSGENLRHQQPASDDRRG